MDIKSAKLRVTMPDGSKWDVPVEVIAQHRAEYFAQHHKDEYPTFGDALAGTWQEFDDAFEIHDWAANNMNWSDVQAHATRAALPPDGAADYDDGWVNGDKEVVQ